MKLAVGKKWSYNEANSETTTAEVIASKTIDTLTGHFKTLVIRRTLQKQIKAPARGGLFHGLSERSRTSMSRASADDRVLGAVLLLIVFLHAIFASGFIPIIHQYLAARAAMAFGLYFAGLVSGQLLIARVARLSRGRIAYPLYELLFGLSLFFMAALLQRTSLGLLVGRYVEGLAGGLSLPLLFGYVVRLEAFGTPERKVALFNAVFALGFVLGPVLVSTTLDRAGAVTVLAFSGAVFIIFAILVWLLLRGRALTVVSEAPSRPAGSWFDLFYLLFLAKCFYGFLLPLCAHQLIERLPGVTITKLMLILSGAFIVGQTVGAQISARIPRQVLRVGLPLALGLATLLLAWPAFTWFVLLVAMLQSWLVFVGFLGLAKSPGSARQFALLSSLADPGMLVGAAAASFGMRGVWPLAALCVVPLLRSGVRALD